MGRILILLWETLLAFLEIDVFMKIGYIFDVGGEQRGRYFDLGW